MAADSQGLADIGAERPNVRALGTDHAERDVLAVDAENVQLMNDDRSRFADKRLSRTSQTIQRHTVYFHGRIHRRQLLDLSSEPFHGFADGGRRDMCRRLTYE